MNTVFVAKWYDYTPWIEDLYMSVEGIFSNKIDAEEFIKSKGYEETCDKNEWRIRRDVGLIDVSINYKKRDEEDGTVCVMNIEEWIVRD